MKASFISKKTGKTMKKMNAKMALSEIGMKEMSPMMMKQALDDAGQVIIMSTKVGYLREVSPAGVKWAPNPEWYKVMKGGAAVLTGPTKKKISAGRWKGYSFKSMNVARMKNTLIKQVTTTSVTVKYKGSGRVEERAEATQYGGKSEMQLVSPSGRDITLDVNIQARPHLGVAANWARLGNKTDPEHIEEIFGDAVQLTIV